LRKIWFRWRSS